MACQHLFIVTGWKTHGLNSSAFHFTCSKCLIDSSEVELNGVSSRTDKKDNRGSVSNKDNLHLSRETLKAD